ncbi:MAG TPA: 2Fe-2S iron-sulfur cluster-binding protein [Terriglobales bacterium]|nr:2Fe-2S iron-sulfur cluster-binding protein [Terriglobales bacterium]
MARLLSLNVGLPRDVTWNGRTVRTAVWKSSVAGRRMARNLNIDGDGQADLAGHAGELRAARNREFGSLLELAEACDVPVRWSCRTGVCHSCMTGLIGGSVRYRPERLERPASGNVLICSSHPEANVILDL